MVGGLFYRNVVDVFTGGNHAFLVMEKKVRKTGITHRLLYGWGLNNYGQLGIGESDNTYKAKEIVSMRDKGIKNIVGGEYHSIMLLENGEAYGCGKNSDFQLGPLNQEELKSEGFVVPKDPEDLTKGEKNMESISKPMKIHLDFKAKQVYANNNYSFAISEANDLKTWGLGFSYVLGNGKEDEIKEPWTINKEKFLKSKVGILSLGGNHVMFTSADSYWNH